MHPEFQRTKHLCDYERINNSLTLYEWKVGNSCPTLIHEKSDDGEIVERLSVDVDDCKEKLTKISAKVWFAGVEEQTLDSVYFRPGYRVQCSAIAVDHNGLIGKC